MTDGDAGFPFRFACQRSGNCCSRPGGVVRVDATDIERIAAHLGMPEAGFRSRYLQPSGDALVTGAGPGCVFLQGGREAGCSIYPVRPAQCRSWPFWEEMKDPERARRAARFCPGITLDRPGPATV